MSSLSSDISALPKPRIIPNFAIDRETLEHLKNTSPMHYLVAVACLKDRRWRLDDPLME